MFKLTWKSWLVVAIGLGAVTGGLTLLLRAQGADTAAAWLAFVGAFLGNGWTIYGLIHWRDTPWVKRVNTFVLTTAGFGLLVLLFLAVDWEPGVRTSAYLYLAVIGFLVGINLLRLLLRPGHPIFGVARTMIEEALRMRIALIFIIALLILLVMMPMILGSEDRVTNMVQRFLTYSTSVVAIFLGLMTVLTGAWSVSSELSSRQAQMTLTKPIARWQYLLGKWLGLVMLNAVLLGVCGVAIFGFTNAIAKNPALNDHDSYQVEREVLTARVALSSLPRGEAWEDWVINFLERPAGRRETNPRVYGNAGDPLGVMAQDTLHDVMSEAVTDFYTIRSGREKSYTFTGLEDVAEAFEQAKEDCYAYLVDEAGVSQADAEDLTDYVSRATSNVPREALGQISQEQYEELYRIVEPHVIQLVLNPAMQPKPDDETAEYFLSINGNYWPPAQSSNTRQRLKLSLDTPNEVPIPASLINSDGTLVLTIEVPEEKLDGTAQPYIQFNPKGKEIDLFYRVGSFEGNLTKALFVVWLKLSFLAMLGLVVGSLLSFPVAALLALIIYVGASASGVINEALDSYGSIAHAPGAWEVFTGTLGKFFSHLGNGEIYDAFKMLTRLIGESFMLLIPSFGQFATTDPLSSGKVISGDLVMGAFLKIGLLWTGAVALIGMFLFSRKEIARVVV